MTDESLVPLVRASVVRKDRKYLCLRGPHPCLHLLKLLLVGMKPVVGYSHDTNNA